MEAKDKAKELEIIKAIQDKFTTVCSEEEIAMYIEAVIETDICRKYWMDKFHEELKDKINKL